MDAILSKCQDEPVRMTYLGIGSAPHTHDLAEFTPKDDQLIPHCFHELILRDHLPMRIIHSDPWFEDLHELLEQYFTRWGLVPLEFPDGYSWVGDTLEVIILFARIDHKEHFSFFEQLCSTIVQHKGKLVIQEYTGYSLHELTMSLLKTAPNKEEFKRHVLIDMSYGTDIGCCTDMTKVQPFYDYDGTFLNLHFMEATDAKRWIGISGKLDELLKQKYKTTYLQTLNHIHVDYRRKLKGDTLLYGSSAYTETSSPDEIMKILQENLREIVELLLALRILQLNQKKSLDDLFMTYKTHDPYKWYDSVRKLLP